MPNILWLQLHKCEDLKILCVINDSKLKISRCRHELYQVIMGIIQFFTTFYRQNNQEINQQKNQYQPFGTKKTNFEIYELNEH